MSTWGRREYLSALAGVGTAGIAGCIGAPAINDDTVFNSRPADGIDWEDEAADTEYGRVYANTIDAVVEISAYDQEGRFGQGSGFVYDHSHVVTNEHVIRNMEYVELRFRDRVWAEGTIAGADRFSDLAVIEVESVPDTAATLAHEEDPPKIGQEVLALGSPFGLEESVSQGIVSARNRAMPTGTGFRIPAAIQTDASVNPGNSGGPLVSMNERYLGVITAKAGEGIGFAISWQLTERVVPPLIEHGRYDHPYIGVVWSSVTPAIARANDLDESRGIIVIEVGPNTPAEGVLQGSPDEAIERGGQRVPVGGDIIIEVDGQPVHSTEMVLTYVGLQASPGDQLEFTLLRDGQRQTVSLELAERPRP